MDAAQPSGGCRRGFGNSRQKSAPSLRRRGLERILWPSAPGLGYREAMSESTRLEGVRELVLRRFLRISGGSLLVGAAVTAPFYFGHGRGNASLEGVAVALVMLGLDRAPVAHRVRALTYIAAVSLGMVLYTASNGLDVAPTLMSLALPFLAVLFVGPRVAVATLLWCAATMAVAGMLETRGLLVIKSDPTAARMAPEFWPFLVLAELFIAGPIIYIAQTLVSHLDSALGDEQRSLAELRLAQDTFAASERLKTLGLLAGAVAHDLNNTLTVIAGEVEMADGLAADSRESILHATSSASQLASQVLLSAGSAISQPRPVDLYRTVHPSLRAIARLMPETVKVHVPKRPPEALRVVADPVLLQQALLNLAVNASDAMPRGGELTVSIERAERKGRACARLEVRDTGHGMDAATLARATEPFFTTKERGRGTGLGLSYVRSTVEAQGGELELRSEQGAGTAVTLWIPITERAAEVDRRPDKVAGGEGRRVLLVEDNLRVRAIAFEILQRGGYQVSEAGDVARARELLAGANAFDVLVSDLTLPDGAGLELARAVRRQHPRAGILITSGYAPTVEDREALARPEFCYLAKPFGAAALASAVADAIAVARGESPGHHRASTPVGSDAI
jgi:signal transduction histidine kinase/ActR/RegA family two-component response regulator